MHSGTSSAAKILRNDINTVNGFTSNGVDIFRKNVDSAIVNWLNQNQSADSSDSSILLIRSTCGDLAGYILSSGLLSNAEKLKRLKDAAHSAVDEFERRFPDRLD